MSLEQVKEKARLVLNNFNSLHSTLKDNKFDENNTSQYISNESFADVFKYIKNMLSFVSNIQTSKNFDNVLPKSAINNINSNLDNLDSQIVSIIQTIAQYFPTYTITQFDYQNIQVYFSSGTAVQIASQLQSIKSYIDNFYNLLPQLYPFIKTGSLLDFSNLIDSISTDRDDITKMRSEAQRSADAIKEMTQTSIESLQNIELTRNKVNSDKDDIESIQANAYEIIKKLEATELSITKIYNEVESLGSKMDIYRKGFQEFESKIKVSNVNIKELENLAMKSEEQNRSREKDIDRIKAEAEAMLVGATNVGLAKHFNDAYIEYKDLANSALQGFHISILVFFISTAATLLFIIPALGDKTSTIYGVLVKTIILIPAIWYLAFSSRRYGTLFSLQKQYKHKAAIAQSIEGFKKEAEDHKQDITAAIFMELAKEPDAHESSELVSKEDGKFVKKNISQVIEAIKTNKS